MAMTDEPVNWFYGLMAERVAEFTPDAHQVPFFQRQIERFGQPVLDVGCGVGRLLLPLLCAGVDIDGCDISGDMLRHCRDKAVSQGLEPRLYHSPCTPSTCPTSTGQSTYATLSIWPEVETKA